MTEQASEKELEGLGISGLKDCYNTELAIIGNPEKVNRGEETFEILERAGQLINSGELVAFPTETVYGLGANGFDPVAVKNIFIAKGRPQDNPLILHIWSKDQIKELIQGDITPYIELMESLWPGPMTLIFKKSKLVPYEVTAGGETVGIRMPSNPCARAFLKACGKPIAAPSANLSGRPSPTNAKDVMVDLGGKISLILDGGASDIGIESTVIDLTADDGKAVILRPGFYTIKDLERFLPGISLDKGLEEGKIPKSPGQKYKHYAPKAELSIFVGSLKSTEDAIIKEYLKRYKSEKVGLLIFKESEGRILRAIKEVGGAEPFHITQGSQEFLEEMAHGLFTNLRIFDKEGLDAIIGQGIKAEGYGLSIMNRMKKAAAGRVKEV